MTQLSRHASVFAVGVGICAAVALFSVRTSADQAPAPVTASSTSQTVVNKYCVSCHNQKARTGGLALDTLDVVNPGQHAEIWERVVEKLRAGSMPPPGRPRPDNATYLAAATELENALDTAWAARPDPGRIGAVHRLNRTEYANAIRDLFGFNAQSIDVQSQLPGDETADGSFDNFADSLSISTAHLERYMSVARQVTRLATALPPTHPTVEMFEVPLHVIQDDRQSEDLPLGSRGGIAVRYHFPVDGEYRIVVRLQRNYQDYLKGMGWEQQLDVRLDGKLLKRFVVGGKAAGPSRRGQLCRRWRAGICRCARVGKVHADRRRCRPRGACAGHRRIARGRRLFRPPVVGARRAAAAAAARPCDHERRSVHGLRERRGSADRWSVPERDVARKT